MRYMLVTFNVLKLLKSTVVKLVQPSNIYDMLFAFVVSKTLVSIVVSFDKDSNK